MIYPTVVSPGDEIRVVVDNLTCSTPKVELLGIGGSVVDDVRIRDSSNPSSREFYLQVEKKGFYLLNIHCDNQIFTFEKPVFVCLRRIAQMLIVKSVLGWRKMEDL